MGVRRAIMLIVAAAVMCATARMQAIGTHFVENFSSGVIGNGGQTWNINMYDDNWVYFANKEGVVQYDGNSWRTFSLDNGHDARALCVSRDEGRVYVAGINEFGYIGPDANGSMHYRCLSDTISKNIGNMWGIFRSGEDLVIQGDYTVMRYRLGDGRMDILPSGVKLDCSAWADGILYLGTESGLKMLIGNNIISAPGAGKLEGQRIRSILPWRGGVIVATANAGLWFYSGDDLSRLNIGYEAGMFDDELFTAAVSGNVLALGTIQNGVIIVDIDTGVSEVYDEETGLQNNTVLSLKFDNAGNLWVGLDYGISRILLDYRTTTLFASHTSIGRGYAIASYDGHLYLGTNRGLYMADYPYTIRDLRPVAGATGQVWDLKVHDGRLLCMHDRGLFEIDGTRSRRIGRNMGTWTIRPRRGSSSGFWAGTYIGAYAMDRDRSGVAEVGELALDYCSYYAFAEDTCGQMWVYDDVRGIVRIGMDPVTFAVDSMRYYEFGSEFPATSQATIAEIDGNMYFATDSGAYRYDPCSDAIVPMARLNAMLGCDRSGCLWLERRGDHLFALTRRELLRLCVHPDTVVDRIPIGGFGDKPLKISDRLYFLDDSTVVVPDYNGFTVYNFTNDPSHCAGYSPIVARINELRLSSAADSVLYAANFLDRRNAVTLPYADNSIIITYGMADPERYGVTAYRYRLSGRQWSEPVLSTVKEYTDLAEGTYTFEVAAEMADGSTVGDSIQFEVLPPWYRSAMAKCAYILLGLICLALIYLFYRKRMRRLERVITADFEHEIRQKDSEIEEIRRQQMESELEHKSQEVVNLLLMLSRNRETMLDLKDELFKLVHAVGANPEAKKLINSLQGKINANMQSDSIMERVEKEFDIVNDGMIKKLRRSYPTLSANEVLMCAYLRMNLSSKEIAPLLNISLRGVETMRYRLRKKFGLERDTSLTDFIMAL